LDEAPSELVQRIVKEYAAVELCIVPLTTPKEFRDVPVGKEPLNKLYEKLLPLREKSVLVSYDTAEPPFTCVIVIIGNTDNAPEPVLNHAFVSVVMSVQTYA
tara:strand:+ start:154 stop:459 length:306 start_codon:yes stop_codon:yes gene_type:complete